MENPNLKQQVESRRTFAIISHPDAGKTTITEQLLLFGEQFAKQELSKERKPVILLNPTGWKSRNNGDFCH